MVVPSSNDHANLMELLGISLNLNLASCWLQLGDFKAAKNYCSLVLRLDFFNVKARFRKACALLNMNLVEDASKDLLVALNPT